MPVVAGIEVREARPGDLEAIAAVALAAGQDEEWGGADPAYVAHLLAHGRVVVGISGGSVIGFGAVRQIGAVSMLCDLFVDPRAHGGGCGRAGTTAATRRPARSWCTAAARARADC